MAAGRHSVGQKPERAHFLYTEWKGKVRLRDGSRLLGRSSVVMMVGRPVFADQEPDPRTYDGYGRRLAAAYVR
jgi:hypothetical protein